MERDVPSESLIEGERIVSSITFDHLMDVAEGRVAAMSTQFLVPEQALIVGAKIAAHPRRKCYDMETSLAFVTDLDGVPAYYDTNQNPEARERYFKNRLASTQILREVCAPYANPVDQVRVLLDDIWPAGTRVQAIGGRPMSVGIARVFREGSGALPHQDMVFWDSDHHPDVADIRSTLSFVVYLTTAEEGGELVVYPLSLEEKDYEALRDPAAPYAVLEDRIPAPAAVIKPTAGQLVVFRASGLHQVRRIKRGTRVTASFFANYRGPEVPLSLDS